MLKEVRQRKDQQDKIALSNKPLMISHASLDNRQSPIQDQA